MAFHQRHLIPLQVPQPGGAVVPARGDLGAIGREHHLPDIALMASQPSFPNLTQAGLQRQ